MISNENTPLINLLEKIETNSVRVEFLVNDKNQLVGSVSQGDIVRALINNSSLKIPSKDIAHLNPIKIIAKKDMSSIEEVAKIIIKKHIHAVPIVDKQNQIIEIITLWDVIGK
mgnify:CR=1 FL=1